MEMKLTVLEESFSGFKFEDVALYKRVLLLEGRMGRLGKKVKYLQEAKVADKRMQSELKSRIRLWRIETER